MSPCQCACLGLLRRRVRHLGRELTDLPHRSTMIWYSCSPLKMTCGGWGVGEGMGPRVAPIGPCHPALRREPFWHLCAAQVTGKKWICPSGLVWVSLK